MQQPIQTVAEVVADEQRLAKLRELNLLDTPTEPAFDRLTRLAGAITGSPVSLVSLVDADRQWFKSVFGTLPEPYHSRRETPLSHSFCQHVVSSGEVLAVEDAREHPVLMHNLAIPDLGVIGYLGVPLTTTEGVELGSFCVIDSKPRQWTQQEIAIIRELALSVMTEIELRATKTALQKQVNLYRRAYRFAEHTLTHMRQTLERGAEPRELLTYIGDMEHELKRLRE